MKVEVEDLCANLGGISSHPMDSRRQNLRNGTRRTSILPVKHVFLHVLLEKPIDIIFSKTEIFIHAAMTDRVGYIIISAS